MRFKHKERRRSLIRLEVSIPLWCDSNHKHCQSPAPSFAFQFHSGAIQTSPSVAYFLPIARFNSTLVRFKHRRQYYNNIFRHAFQFHSGAIQTAAISESRRKPSAFQFHSGAIQTCSRTLSTTLEGKFQFHSGAIQTRRR